MTVPATIHDRVLHLSLPDWRTALKRRVKRPKHPLWGACTFVALPCLILNALGVIS